LQNHLPAGIFDATLAAVTRSDPELMRNPDTHETIPHHHR
jgi:hypothetical protein